jgi:hypothetical protein
VIHCGAFGKTGEFEALLCGFAIGAGAIPVMDFQFLPSSRNS